MLLIRPTTCCLIALCLSACGSENSQSQVQSECATLSPIGAKVGQPTKGSLAIAFSVASCEGDPISGLEVSDFQIFEDDQPIVASEAGAIILDRKPQLWISLVLDNSPSIADAGAVDSVADASIGFVESLFAAGNKDIYVSVSFFSKKLETKLAFSNQKDKVIETLNGYRADKTGSNTTNLYGGLLDALTYSAKQQQIVLSSTQGDVLVMGQVIMFTDGADLAGVVSLEKAKSAVSASTDRVTMVAFGPDANQNVLDELSTRKSFVTAQATDLQGLFSKVGAQVASERDAVYLLGYCSPKLAGEHKLQLRMGDKGASPWVVFNADGFDADDGPECSVQRFLDACTGSACGGLWCGELCTAQGAGG